MKKNCSYLILIVSGFFFLSCTTEAQNYKYHTKNKGAIKCFEDALVDYGKFDDKSALKNLECAINKDDKFGEAYFLKARIMFEKFQYDEAEVLYLKTLEIDEKDFVDAYAELGDMYHEQFKFGKASSSYLSYIKKGKLSEQNLIVYGEKAFANHIADSLVSNPVPFEPKNMGPNINSELNEYHPAITADGEYLIFTVRKGQYNPNCPYMMMEEGEEDFYYSKLVDGEWTSRANVGAPLNSSCHEGAANLSPDGRYLFFYSARDRDDLQSRNSIKDIYVAEKLGSKWGNIKRLPPPVNTPHFESQPSFSSDGKTMYFSSDRPGGVGGQDIWVTTKNSDGTWTEPINMGKKINTIGDEVSPFIHPDNQTLYFVSNGWYGVGGSDFYYSRMDEKGKFTEAKNLGFPINTPFDERSLIISADGTKGYFASKNLEGMGEYDLYWFELYPEAQPIVTTYLKGHIYDLKDKKSLKARFELIDVESGNTIVSSFSDKETGEFLVPIPKNKQYALNVSAEGYLPYSGSFNMILEDAKKTYLIDIGLNSIEIGVPFVLKNIFFQTDKFELEKESTAELNKLVEFLNNNPTIKIEVSGHTDNVGSKSHNQVLSENRAKSVYDFLISKGIAANRLTYKGYGDTKPIADNNTEEGRAMNRRTEFKVTSK